MAVTSFNAEILAVTTGGPYMYLIYKDNIVQKVVTGVANVAAALDGVKVDVAALLNGQSVTTINMSIYAS